MALQDIKDILEKYSSEEMFFRWISATYPTLDPRYKMIKRAYFAVKDAFRGKLRESGEDYFEHLRRSTLIMMIYLGVDDYRDIIAMLMHDMDEDIDSWPISRIMEEFDEDIGLQVEWMSHPKRIFPEKEECERVYHNRFKYAPRNFFVKKFCDRIDNIMTLWGVKDFRKRKKKIEETEKHYLPQALIHQILYHELIEALDETKNQLEIDKAAQAEGEKVS